MKRIDPTKVPDLRSDDNVGTYRPDRDGRNVAERIRHVPLRGLVPSPHQTRLVTDPVADHELGEDLDRRGLTQLPVVTPHPERDDVWITVVGHRRIAQARRLAAEGRGTGFLGNAESDGPGDWTIPVLVRELDPLEAYGHTVAENLVRQDLRPWEQVRALVRHQEMLEEQGSRASVRGVANSLDQSRSTVGPYLQVGNALTPDVLEAAGVVSREKGEPYVDHETLCKLSLEALLRAARRKTPERRAEVLQSELRKVAPDAAEATRDPSIGEDGKETQARRGFQLNIRRPLESLGTDQAKGYLARLAPPLMVLLEQVSDDPAVYRIPGDGQDLVLVNVPSGASRNAIGSLMDKGKWTIVGEGGAE